MSKEIIEMTPEEKEIELQKTKDMIRRRGMLKFIFSDWTEDDVKDLPFSVQESLAMTKMEWDRACPTIGDKVKQLWPTITETCSDIKEKFPTVEDYLEQYGLTSEVKEAGDVE